MEFYTSSENYGYDSIQVTDREPRKFVKPESLFSFRKTERFSTLSAEERWNYTKKINALQKLINEIQTSKEPITETPAFSLEEVLEVLKVRMAMHEK